MQNLASKKWLCFLKRTKKCELNYSERVVYSYLVYQSGYQSGASIGSISRFTGLSRDVIPAILKRLCELRLAVDEDGDHFALMPSGETAEWFPRRKSGGIAYYPIYLVAPCCPLSDRQNALYWCLCDLDRKNVGLVKNQTESGLATLLSVTRQTIRSAFKVLCNYRLIKIGNGKRTLAFQIAPFPLEWLRERDEARISPDEEEEYTWETDLDKIAQSDILNTIDKDVKPKEQDNDNRDDEPTNDNQTGRDEYHDHGTTGSRVYDPVVPTARTIADILYTPDERRQAIHLFGTIGLRDAVQDFLVQAFGNVNMPSLGEYQRLAAHAKSPEDFKALVENFYIESKNS